MITDSQTNFLYLADTLPTKYPDFYKRFENVLNNCNIPFDFLPQTKGIWAIDYMPIPNNITREHVFQAMLKVHREGVPAGRQPRQWAVNYEEEFFPCKLLISWSNIYANGEELDPDPKNFQTYMAQDYLTTLGFNIIPI